MVKAQNPGDAAGLLKGLTAPVRVSPEQWNPPFCGDIDMRIGADGTWYYLGTPIGRAPLVKLFAAVLRREGEAYYLVTPVEKVGIRVDDAPFMAVRLRIDGEGEGQQLHFDTNVDDEVAAGPEHPLRFAASGEGLKPYVRVRGGLEALVTRSLYYELVQLGTVRDGWFGIWSGGRFFAMQRASEIDVET
jgi:hypothetical protein